MSARTYVLFTLGATSLDLDFSNTSSSQAPLPCTAGSRHQQASSQQPAASSQAPLPWRWAPRVPWGCNVKCLGKPSHWNDVERKHKFRTMTSNRLEQQKTPSCFNISCRSCYTALATGALQHWTGIGPPPVMCLGRGPAHTMNASKKVTS